MKLSPHDKIIIRTPQFAYTDQIKDCWQDLKQSIAMSSPEFYKLIEQVEAKDIDVLPQKTRQTVERYFNRTRFRAVPYGSFASFGLLNNGNEENSNGPIIISRKQEYYQLIDWTRIKDIPSYEFKDLLESDARIFTNSSYYTINENIRYLTRTEDKFELADIDLSPQILKVLKAASFPIRLSLLKNKVTGKDQSDSDFYSLVEAMILAQLLFTEKDPNIIGKDYFQRRNFIHTNEYPAYVITSRSHINGRFPEKQLKSLEAYINFMAGIDNKQRTAEDMLSFTERFSKRFERQQVLLMVALDPELGVGYGDLDLSARTSPLIAGFIKCSVKSKSNADAFENFLHARLLNDLKQEPIRLEEFEQQSLSKSKCIMPNVLSCICSISDNLLIAERIGGHSTNQLAGRFSVLGGDKLVFCREIATTEADANPDVVFFDLAYLAEPSVDNVNRREQIYQYELNILNYCHEGAPITLDDIYINVASDEVILRSKKLGKRLVPRMASAYNYRRSDLPLLKFLCDLMYHGVKSDFSVNLHTTVPGREFYPRVQYKDIVVAPACWRISQSDGNEIALSERLRKLNVSRFIKVGEGDQTLCLDTHSESDRSALMKVLSKNKEALLQEAFLPERCNVVDESGKPYLAQFIIPMVHREQVYNGSGRVEDNDKSLPTIFAPGSQWLSFEIYCHPLRADEVLTEEIGEVLTSFNPYILKWFFIRYNQNGEHIRLRVHLKNINDAGKIIGGIEKQLRDQLQSGSIFDIVLSTYRRETERYAMAGMEKVEKVFYQDSYYVMNMLRSMLTDEKKYSLCIKLFYDVRDGFVFNLDKLERWVTEISSSFNKEHHIDNNGFKRINSYSREKGIPFEVPLNNSAESSFIALTNAIVELLTGCPEHRRIPLFTDLLHMHINRLFQEHQRLHEMVFYNLLKTCIHRDNAITKKIKHQI